MFIQKNLFIWVLSLASICGGSVFAQTETQNALPTTTLPAPPPPPTPKPGMPPADISVGTARIKKTVVAIAPIRLEGKVEQVTSVSKTIESTLFNDLIFMDLFKFLPKESFLEKPADAGIYPGQFKFSDWTAIGAEVLVKTSVKRDGNNIHLTGVLYDPVKQTQLFAKEYAVQAEDGVLVAHQLGNDIVTTLTGLPGIFLTKIVMVCDLTNNKELYVMDFDGSNTRQLTHHKSLSLGPAWNPEGSKIAYSLYTYGKNGTNVDLYELDFASKKTRMLANKKGINSGAVYSPDGSKIALTMSFNGNPEIYTIDLKSSKLTQLTHSFGFDVDPNFSPDGKMMAFVSTRSGKPMVYSMNAEIPGSEPKRLTIAGQYNATPSWSKQNNKIAFAGWIDRGFDIFIMNPNGTQIERLTKNQGTNEDPHFSPDGNFLVFTSNRTGKKNIYVMNIEGTFVRRLTYGLGECSAPKWSMPPKR